MVTVTVMMMVALVPFVLAFASRIGSKRVDPMAIWVVVVVHNRIRNWNWNWN